MNLDTETGFSGDEDLAPFVCGGRIFWMNRIQAEDQLLPYLDPLTPGVCNRTWCFCCRPKATTVAPICPADVAPPVPRASNCAEARFTSQQILDRLDWVLVDRKSPAIFDSIDW